MSDYLQILDGLRATRDADSCLRGLNLFRKALRGDDGPTFLARYLRQSPDWQELQAVWDTQLTVQHYHVTVTLLLTLADALRKASAPQPAAAGATAEEQAQQAAVLAGGAASLTSAVLHRRLKALYFCLSSDVHGKANAALTLLEAVAATCGAPLATCSSTPGRSASGGTVGSSPVSLRDFVRSFDWSLSALPGLAKPPREKKSEAAADHRKRYWQQWALGDPLKRPCRAAFCQLALTLLRQAGASGDALLVQQLLHLRPLMGGLLTHLAADPPHQQLVVLQMLQQRVIAAKAAVPAAAQAEVFSDATLQQLAAIAMHAPALGEDEEAEEEEEEAEAAGQRQAAAAAQAVLLAVATDPSHGLTLAAAAAAGPSFVLADAGSQQLQPGQRRLLRMLLRLRPADSAGHLQLLLAAVAGDASLAAALLLALPYSLEPAAAGTAAGSAAAGRWFAHTAVASRLLQLLPETAAPGLALRAASGGAAPPPGGRQAQALLRCCFPACLQKAALSRGLQHSNALVRHGTLALLISSMSVLEAVLGDCTAAAATGAAATSAGSEHPLLAPQQQGWLALRGWLQQAARQHLPDPTLLLALLAGSEKEGWENANELQLTAVLRLLLLWQRLLPAALVEASVDAERLMPSQPLGLRPQHQLLLLELLAAAAEASAAAAAATDGGAAAAAVAATSAAPVLLAALRLLSAPRVAAPVRVAARDWLARRLLATGAFSGNEEEAVLWLDLLPRGGKGSEALASFLSEAVQLLLRRPHELYEQQQQLLAAAAGGATGDGSAEDLQDQEQAQPQFSLLAPCALRQLLRMLPSSKIPSADKAAVVAYVAAVLGQLAQQQLGAPACAQLAAVLVGIVRLEALRQQGLEQPPADAAASKQKKQKKRKLADGDRAVNGDTAVASLALPAEGWPLLALLAALEQQGGGAEAAGEGGRKGQKRGSSAADGQLRPAAVVQPDSAVDEEFAELQAADGTGGACCQLISQLTAAGNSSSDTASLLAAVQQHLAGNDGGSCGAAVRQCLHLLDSRNAPAAAEAALLQVLQAAAVLGGNSGSVSQLRCLQLLAGSTCVARSLAPGGNTALAAAVTQLMLRALTAPSAGADASAAAACCAPLLQRVAAEVEPVLAAALSGKADSDSMPAAAQRFLLLLPCMPAAAVDELAGVLVGGLAPPPPPRENGSRQKRKKRAEAAPGLDAGQHSWLAALAAAVLQQQLTGGSLGGQPGQLGQACRLLLLLASTSTAAEAAADTGGAKGGSLLADATECFLQVLNSSHQGAALAALGTPGQLQLLRCCLSQAAAGSDAALRPCAQLAALLVLGSSDCRRLAAVELLPALLAGGSASALALALPAAASCVKQQQQKEGEQPEEGLHGDIEGGLAATLHQQLMPYFSGRKLSLGLHGKQQDGSKRRKEKKRKSSSGDVMAPAAHPAAALLAAAAQQLLRQHALPCLRLVHPCSANEGYQQVPAQGWLTSSAAQPADNLVHASAGESAEAAVLLLTAGGSRPAVEDLAACVHCVAVTLTGLLRLPPSQSPEESRLLDLLDGPLGDAVAALPASQRSSAAFAELAEVVAGTLGTAVLRHRLTPAAAGGTGAEAGAAAAAVAVVRVLRRLLAALLPDDEEVDEVAAGGGDTAGNSSSDEDMPQQQQQQQQGTSRTEVAAAALQLLQRLLGHSRFLPAMRAAAAACPPPLPPAAAALPRPLVSLLPLAAAADKPSVAAAEQKVSSTEVAADLKKELCEVLETLLDLHQQYSSGTSSTSSARKAAAEQQLLVQAAEAALLPLLMAGYGASCSPSDAATWSLAAAINRRQWLRQAQAQQQQQQQPAAGQDTEEDELATAAALLAGEGGDAEGVSLTALLHGPLSQTCFAWGPAAAALQQAASGGTAASADQQQQQQQQQRALLQQRLPLEPARAALTVCHWSEACSLSAPGSGAASSPASQAAGSGSDGGLAQLPAVAAAYDPGFLLPFCCACLQRQLLPPRAFAEAGLLSVCLRGLAAADSGCRAAAYQALALFEAQLGAAAAPDFRERQQLSVLLGALRASVVRPFQRLPAVHAVFLAEAALLALHPGAPMYPAANKHLTRRAVLSTTDVPLLGQLLLAGGQQHVAERRWMMQLLLAGLRTASDAELYRRQHVLELAMSLSDSYVADPEAAAMALRLLCAATYIPRASRQLVQESGLIPWLAQAAQGAAVQRSHDGRAAEGEQALAALRRLLHLRAVMRGSGGGAAVRQMTAAGCQLASVALAGAGSGGGSTRSASAAGPAGSPRSLLLLEFLQGVQELEGTSQAAGQARWQHLDGGNSAALSAAIDALHHTLRPSQSSK